MRIVSEDGLRRLLAARPATCPRVVSGGNFAVPWTLLRLVDEIPTYRLFMLNAPASLKLREGVIPETPFVGAGMRGHPDLAYLPCRLSLVPRLLERHTPPDIVLLNTSLPRNGTVSLGIEVNVLPAAIEAVRASGGLVVAQFNRAVPYTFGDAQIPLEDVDLAIEVDEPLGELPPCRPTDVHLAIAEQVAALVPEHATLQMGIGAVPDAVLTGLTSRKHLRIWTEMLSDGVLRLAKAGALDPDAVVTTSFVGGSAELYAWLDRNPKVYLARTEVTNNPSRIARRHGMTSVNSALQVDLFGQANASYIRGQVYSGFGGQTDFIVGALHATRGHAIIALPSWHERAGVSTIVPALTAPATSFQHSYVVTDQGTARIWGATQHEQATALIDHAAHPDAREHLRAEARALGLL